MELNLYLGIFFLSLVCFLTFSQIYKKSNRLECLLLKREEKKVKSFSILAHQILSLCHQQLKLEKKFKKIIKYSICGLEIAI